MLGFMAFQCNERVETAKKDPKMNVTYYLFAGTFTHSSLIIFYLFLGWLTEKIAVAGTSESC